MPNSPNPDTRTRRSLIRPLDQEDRPTVCTAAAAFYLSRADQTMRAWAARGGKGALTPVRVNGRLAWKVADIRAALGVQP